MKFLIVHAHPEPASFCAAMCCGAAEALRADGHEVEISDLYAQRFDPVGDRRDFTSVKDSGFFKYQAEQLHAVAHDGFAADVAAEQRKLLWSDFVIFQFPLWWFSVPAIMKGWFDRVLAMGFAYGGGRWFENGPLAPRRALIAMTAGAPRERYLEGNIFGGIERVLYPLEVGVLNLAGLAAHEPFIAWAATRIGHEARQDYLKAYIKRLRGIAHEAPQTMHRVADHPDPYHGTQPLK
ncbi:MAG: NAD(P)H-dependent oxidoreductase [Alphaproteobacteria bacterium]|nr:NAD(P)H-dependent oxidoreductase [Alphaproteobacteria bacterium]